jgi:hypothetical protein
MGNQQWTIQRNWKESTKDEDKQNKNTTQYLLGTTIYANKHIRYEPSYKQLEVKMNRTLFLCGNRNGHHNMELRMSRHI